MNGDYLCQCPKCGRNHRHLGFGRPPSIVAVENYEVLPPGALRLRTIEVEMLLEEVGKIHEGAAKWHDAELENCKSAAKRHRTDPEFVQRMEYFATIHRMSADHFRSLVTQRPK
jgi:hypothetical protein